MPEIIAQNGTVTYDCIGEKMTNAYQVRPEIVAEKTDCRFGIKRPKIKDCDNCILGPCYCHDCDLGNQIVNYNFLTMTFSLTIQREKWRKQKKKRVKKYD